MDEKTTLVDAQVALSEHFRLVEVTFKRFNGHGPWVCYAYGETWSRVQIAENGETIAEALDRLLSRARRARDDARSRA